MSAELAGPLARGFERSTDFYNTLRQTHWAIRLNLGRITSKFRTSFFLRPVHDKHYFPPVAKPTGYQDATALRIEATEKTGKKFVPSAVQTAGGKAVNATAKFFTRMSSIACGSFGPSPKRRNDRYDWTVNPLTPKP
jgi:hypothetical protein